MLFICWSWPFRRSGESGTVRVGSGSSIEQNVTPPSEVSYDNFRRLEVHGPTRSISNFSSPAANNAEVAHVHTTNQPQTLHRWKRPGSRWPHSCRTCATRFEFCSKVPDSCLSLFLHFYSALAPTLRLSVSFTPSYFDRFHFRNRINLFAFSTTCEGRTIRTWGCPLRNSGTKDRSGVFQEISAVAPSNAAVVGGDRTVRAESLVTSPDYFTLLGARAQIGRVYTQQDAVSGFLEPVVISDGFWRSNFGSDPNIVGRKIHLTTTCTQSSA